MITCILAVILCGAGIVLLLDLTPDQITQDLIDLLTPKDSLRELSHQLRENKDRHRLYRNLVKLRTALISTGKSRQFSLVCASSLLGAAVGVVLSVLLGNLFLLPVLTVACAILPFAYIYRVLNYYEKSSNVELETTLSLITASYIRTENIKTAIEENLPVIRYPLHSIFQAFVTEVTVISPSVKQAIIRMKGKIDDEVFQEWCDVLIRCQDDWTLSDTLQPTVAKLTDIRVINDELQTMVYRAKVEYQAMSALVALSIPFMYAINKDWFHILMNTTAGKIVVSICAAVLLITALLAERYTQPIKFKK